MNNNTAPGTSLFGNSTASLGTSLFGQNKGTNPPAANSNPVANLFGGGTTSFVNLPSTTSPSNNPTSLFGSNTGASTNPPATGNLFGVGGGSNNNKQAPKTGFNLGGAPTNNGATSLFSGIGNTSNNNPTNTNTAGTLGATTTAPIPVSNTIANGLNAPISGNSNSLFGNNSTSGSNPLGGVASNTLGNPAKETAANTASNSTNPTNLFGNNANSTTGGTSFLGGATTATNPASSPNPLKTAPFFGTSATAPNVASNGITKPAETANTTTTTSPATNLFANHQPNNSQPSTAPTAPTAPIGATTTNPLSAGNLFSQIPPKSAANGSLTTPPLGANTANTNLTAGSPPNAGTFVPTNPTISVPQNTLQADFQKSNQSVDEYLNEYRTTLLKSYEDIRKLAENSLKLLEQREQNQRIVNNFKEIETQLLKEGKIQKKLQDLQRKQEQIAFQIEVMSRKVGQGMYTHELSEHLQEYGQLKKMITQMEDDQVERNDTGHEQLLNIFYSLNQVEMQIRDMNQTADIFLKLA